MPTHSHADRHPQHPDVTEVDKIRVRQWLKKKFGVSEADIPDDLWRELWSKDRDDRTWFLQYQIAPEARRAQQDKKRAAWRERRGLPPNLDINFGAADRVKLINAARVRQWRAKQPKTSKPFSAQRPLPPADLTREWIKARHAKLKAWTAGDDPQARQLRGRESEILKVLTVYHQIANKVGRVPTYSEIADKLGCSPAAARKRMQILHDLYTRGAWKKSRR
jgi:hypothetical protein